MSSMNFFLEKNAFTFYNLGKIIVCFSASQMIRDRGFCKSYFVKIAPGSMIVRRGLCTNGIK